ncbi:MAG: ABC transporter permease [Candidatus Aminicenantes bacterium]|nr:MAG: ABC transporter permease [Candidatus Aminicenantes bacterium]
MFDLERAIQQWKKALHKNSVLEDGYKEELENHLKDKIEYLMNHGSSEEEAFEEAVKKIGEASLIGEDYYKTDTRHVSGRPPWKKGRWIPPLFSNYFRIGLRKIKRQKIYSLINIVGLAVGLACCAVIILYVTNELSYDSFHGDADRIYRVAVHRINIVGEFRFVATPAPLGPELKNSYPEVEQAVRVVPPYENASNVLVVQGEKRFFENRVWFADEDIYELFHMPFIQGNPRTALSHPNNVVITEGMANKYFGEEAALGQTLQIEIDYDTGSVELQDYEVTGVIKNAPVNTHLKYDMFLSMATMRSNLSSFEEDWFNPKPKYTYVKLAPGTDVAGFEEKLDRISDFVLKSYSEKYNRKMDLYDLFLQPVTKIHMFSHLMREIEPPGNWYYLYIYSIIAFLILLIGCLNFINLSAALSTTRTKEVGLRKVVGAQRKQLIWQFLGESFLITLLAFILAFGLASLLLIPFNQMAGTELSLGGLTQPVVFLSLLGLLLFVSIGSGIYPALILTAFNPVSVLQGKLAPTTRGALAQKILVVGQFAISIFLVICALTVFKQLQFMKGRALGFDLEQKLVLRVKSNMPHLRRDYEAIKNDFLQNSSIFGATVSSNVPGDDIDSGYYLTPRPEDFKGAPFINVITMDHDFISQFDIQMVAGRAFQKEMGNDEREGYLINLAAVKELGFSSPEEALGKNFMASYHRINKRIIGVTDDFHYRGMQEVVEPLIMDIENSLFNTITLSIRVENMNELMGFVQDKWDDHFPGIPFEYSFLDENFDRVYRYEDRMGRLLGIITSLGLVIACLGLFGLASFFAQFRKKEIGIRKVLGASTSDIVAMLSKKFVLLILISIVVASPIAWYAMNLWLQDFAYRIHMSPVAFFMAAGGALALAVATVSIQGIRAAVANPSQSLRNE